MNGLAALFDAVGEVLKMDELQLKASKHMDWKYLRKSADEAKEELARIHTRSCEFELDADTLHKLLDLVWMRETDNERRRDIIVASATHEELKKKYS